MYTCLYNGILKRAYQTANNSTTITDVLWKNVIFMKSVYF